MTERETIQKHPSYGLLKIARTHGGNGNLFGSSIKQHEKIELTVTHASVRRSLSDDSFMTEGRPIIEIAMSPTQFAEAITSLNQGLGVPCTILHENGKRVEECDFTNKRNQFENEMKEHMKELNRKLKKLTESAEDILTNKKSVGKADRENILNQIAMLRQEIHSNVPFMLEQFNEQMDKTVTEAKMEVDSYTQRKVHEFGLQKMEEFKQLGSSQTLQGLNNPNIIHEVQE